MVHLFPPIPHIATSISNYSNLHPVRFYTRRNAEVLSKPASAAHSSTRRRVLWPDLTDLDTNYIATWKGYTGEIQTTLTSPRYWLVLRCPPHDVDSLEPTVWR